MNRILLLRLLGLATLVLPGLALLAQEVGVIREAQAELVAGCWVFLLLAWCFSGEPEDSES